MQKQAGERSSGDPRRGPIIRTMHILKFSSVGEPALTNFNPSGKVLGSIDYCLNSTLWNHNFAAEMSIVSLTACEVDRIIILFDSENF